MNVPKVLSEVDTLEAAIAGKNLARFGDSEIKIMLGKSAIAQETNSEIAEELKSIIKSPNNNCLPCIPNMFNDLLPIKDFWIPWRLGTLILCNPEIVYGSTWISRGDDAPWINSKEYWDRVKDIWRDKNIALITNSGQSLKKDYRFKEANSIKFIEAPSTSAYSEIDKLEAEALKFEGEGPILLSLGATATVLANRLAIHNRHAIDLGHIGMSMNRWEKEQIVSFFNKKKDINAKNVY